MTKKIMVNLAYAISAAFLLWVFISWGDVVLHNMSTCQYLSWNFFALFF